MIAISIAALIRLVCWYLVIATGTPPNYDEPAYLASAQGIAHLVQGLLGGGVDNVTLIQAYGGGIRPPLHPLLLSLAYLMPGGGLSLARFIVVAESIATAWLLWKLAHRVVRGSDLVKLRSANVAVIIYGTLPVFIGMSHQLWSESLSTLITLWAIWLTLNIVESGGKRWASYLGLGAVTGLLLLSRSASLLPAIVLMGFSALVPSTLLRKTLVGCAVLGSATAIVLPWMLILQAREGRFVLLGTAGGYNAALGNNEFGMTGFEDGARHMQARETTASRLTLATGKRGIGNWDQEGSRIARAWIAEHPAAFLGRCFTRTWCLWGSDWYVPRHFEGGVYRNVPPWVFWGIWALLVAGHVGLLVCGGLGFLEAGIVPEYRRLALLLIGASCVLPALTITATRFNYTNLVMLCPFAGWALTQNVRALAARHWQIASILVLAVAIVTATCLRAQYSVLPHRYPPPLSPSSEIKARPYLPALP